MAFKYQTREQRLNEKIDKEVDKISQITLDALNGDRGIRNMDMKTYTKEIVKLGERRLTGWNKNNMKGVDFREVFRSLVLAGYKIEIKLTKGDRIYGNV